MQISTSTRIVLSQDELKEAAFAFVMAKMPTMDAKYTVEFEDDDNGDLTAVINIQSEDGSDLAKPEPKKTRGRKASSVKAAEPVVEVDAEDDAKDEYSEGSQEPTEDSATEAPEETDTKEETADEAPVAAEAPSNKIFPDIGTSAPATAKPETPPAASPKSLFANLTKPVNTH